MADRTQAVNEALAALDASTKANTHAALVITQLHKDLLAIGVLARMGMRDGSTVGAVAWRDALESIQRVLGASGRL